MSRQRARLAGVEHCKEYIRELFQAFQDGSGSEDAPFTLELAVAAAWRKMDQVLLEQFPKELRGTVRMRVACEPDKEVQFPGAVSVRKLGARPFVRYYPDGSSETSLGEDVYYVIVPARDHTQVLEIVKNLAKTGCKVRDWEFYG